MIRNGGSGRSRGDVDNPSPMARAHARHDGFHREEWTGEIGLGDIAPVLQTMAADRLMHSDPHGANENVDGAALSFDNGAERAPQTLRSAHPALVRMCSARSFRVPFSASLGHRSAAHRCRRVFHLPPEHMKWHGRYQPDRRSPPPSVFQSGTSCRSVALAAISWPSQSSAFPRVARRPRIHPLSRPVASLEGLEMPRMHGCGI